MLPAWMGIGPYTALISLFISALIQGYFSTAGRQIVVSAAIRPKNDASLAYLAGRLTPTPG
jgi:hypothetical protein